ncbi:hypothetical protein O3M35_010931 [Rhynocoris fuscipes]|uniref:C3H1-type domain-containing protein n=1 Tax=Rhynocoris fuscipes TaxID=488301 RepID=A0AAW1D3Y0_9HEMI
MTSLVADYGESSHESSDDSDSDQQYDKSDIITNTRLPPPAFTDKIKNSVFVNPYLEAENAQFAVLEKHVKMVPQNNNTKSNKKICWMFKKGKCRFGKKCKFSHAEDHHTTVTTTVGNTVNQDSSDNNSSGGCMQETDIKVINENFNSEEELINNSDNEEEYNKKRKKHPGLTQGLIPSKKVIKMYKKQKGEGK